MKNIEFKITCEGTLQKSHPKSCFATFKITSNYFQDSPLVLQTMIVGDWMIVEYLPQEVYENYLTNLT